MTKPYLIGWLVQSIDRYDYDAWSYPLLAQTHSEAIAQGAGLYDYDEEYVEAIRAPEWDQYASLGHIPLQSIVNAGWKVPCHNCETLVESGMRKDYFTYDEDDEEIEIEPIFTKTRCFCSKECLSDYDNKKLAMHDRQHEVVQYLTDKYPHLTDLHVTGGWEDYPVYASFHFGGKYKADYNTDEKSDCKGLTIRQIDLAAWHEFTKGS
jgi:hypothetical protein